MSTILNTLKKLEEEKSVLDRNLNLKGLVLQTDRSAFPRQELERGNHARGLIALIAAGIVVGVGLGVYFNPSEKATAKSLTPEKRVQPPAPKASVQAETPPVTPSAPVSAPEPVQVQPVPAPAVQKEVAMGIPLSSIQEPAKAKSPSPAVEPPKTNPVQSAPQPPAQVAKASPPQPPAKKSAPAASVAPVSPFVEQHDDGKPESEIIAMEILPESYEIDEMIGGAKVNKLSSPPPPRPKDPGVYSGASIPGVKMKGIIYFSTNNPSNYILVSGPQEINKKIKIGDTYQEATLKDVQPDRAIFAYKGELTQLRIGE